MHIELKGYLLICRMRTETFLGMVLCGLGRCLKRIGDNAGGIIGPSIQSGGWGDNFRRRGEILFYAFFHLTMPPFFS